MIPTAKAGISLPIANRPRKQAAKRKIQNINAASCDLKYTIYSGLDGWADWIRQIAAEICSIQPRNLRATEAASVSFESGFFYLTF